MRTAPGMIARPGLPALALALAAASAGAATLSGRVELMDRSDIPAGFAVQVLPYSPSGRLPTEGLPPGQPLAPDGTFSIERPDSEAGYLLVVRDADGRPVHSSYAGGRDAADVRLRVNRAGWLIGIVWGADDRPLPDVEVLLERRLMGRRGSVLPVGRARTAADGGFEFRDIGTGSHRCRVVSGDTASEPVDVQVGEDMSFIELRAAPAGMLTGRAVDPSGRPLAGVEVVAAGQPSVVTGADGAFRIGGLGADDSVEVRAEGAGHALRHRAPVEVRVGPGATVSRDLALEPTGVLLLRLEPETPRVVLPARVTLSLSPSRESAGGYGGLEATVSHGRARVAGLAPGAYRLSLLGEGDSIDGGRVEIPAGGQAEAQVRMPFVARVRGRLSDVEGQPVAGAQVQLAGSAGGRPFAGVHRHPESSDAAGRFLLVGIPEGASGIQVRHPDFVATNFPVRIERSGDTEASFVLQRGLSVTGRVVDAEGGGLPGAYVTLRRPGGMALKAVRADAEGRFVFRGLDPGPAEISVRHERGAPRVVPLQAAAGLPEIEVRMGEGLSISGRVAESAEVPPEALDLQAVDRAGGGSVARVPLAADGRFVLGGLGPGRYLVVARERASGLPAGLAGPFEHGTRQLELRFARRTPVPLVLDPVPSDGEGAAWLSVAWSAGAHRVTSSVNVGRLPQGPDGRPLLPLCRGLRYELSLFRRGWQPARVAVDGAGDAPFPPEVVLRSAPAGE